MNCLPSQNLLLGLLCICLCSGCEGFIVTSRKYDVEAMARDWPPYQPPNIALADPQTGGVRRDPSAIRSPLPSSRPASVLRELEETMRLIRPHTDWSLQETAMDSLGRIGAPAVPELMKTLEHNDPVHRQRAAEVLARIGPEAANAVPQLIQRLNDDQEPVRRAAARALGQIGPDAEAAVKPLVQALEEASAVDH